MVAAFLTPLALSLVAGGSSVKVTCDRQDSIDLCISAAAAATCETEIPAPKRREIMETGQLAS